MFTISLIEFVNNVFVLHFQKRFGINLKKISISSWGILFQDTYTLCFKAVQVREVNL